MTAAVGGKSHQDRLMVDIQPADRDDWRRSARAPDGPEATRIAGPSEPAGIGVTPLILLSMLMLLMLLMLPAMPYVILLVLPGVLLVGIWLYHLRWTIDTCDRIGTLGAGSAGHLSLEALATCRTCDFTAADGQLLRGSLVHHRSPGPRRGIVVFCHEFRGDRHSAAPYITGLLERGFDVFSFDFRNHGQSSRMSGYDPRAWTTEHEVSDVLGAVAFVRSQKDADPRGVALMGLSRGGSAALTAAGRCDGIWGVVTDGAFVSHWVTASTIRRFIPQFVPFAPLLVRLPWCLHCFYGAMIQSIVARRLGHTCINLAQEILAVHQPWFMIHGGRDSTVPVELARRLRKLVPRRPRLWIVPAANHNRSLRRASHRYHQRLCRFLERHAKRPASRQARLTSGDRSLRLPAAAGSRAAVG